MATDTYKKTLLDCFPRIISNCDRNKYSPSFGCFDRNFWHYKIVDTPSARLQEGVLTLGLLYFDQESLFFRKENIKELIGGGLRFWLKIQAKDGSFNEWYPQEKSFVATAFSSYAVSETLLLLPEIKEKEEVIAGLKKAAGFLSSKKDEQALNQNAGALAALYNIFLLTGDDKYQKECNKIIDFLEERQSEEGWFYEYGGADIGYLSLTLDYLAKYYLKSKDEKAYSLLKNGLSFLAYFVHPDGSVGGVYGSRNTAYLIPSAVEILANFLPLAQKISFVLQESIQSNNIVSLSALDDRYLIQNGYTYLQASWQLKQRSFAEKENIELPSIFFEDKHFPKAGIFIKSTENFYCIINYKKGGAFYCYDRLKKASVCDSGLLLKKGNNKYTSSYIAEGNEIMFSSDSKTISIKGRLKKIAFLQLTPLRFVSLRILLFSSRFVPHANTFIKSALRSLLISRKKISPFFFERSFLIDNNILIKDKFSPKTFKQGQVGGILELIYTPSSRFFNNNFIYFNAREIEKEELLNGQIEHLT